MTDPTCTDDDLARALDYARRLTASGVADAGTLLARALLRLEAELASARAALAEERIESSRRQSGIERLIADKAKLNSELAAITAALDGQPLPPDAGERARRVAEAVHARDGFERLIQRIREHEGAAPTPTEDAHVWTTRDGLPVCSRCGVVRNAGRVTPCKGTLPAVEVRGEPLEIKVDLRFIRRGPPDDEFNGVRFRVEAPSTTSCVWALVPEVGPAIRLWVSEDALRSGPWEYAPAEDDGLRPEERAAGWRWIARGGSWWLHAPGFAADTMGRVGIGGDEALGWGAAGKIGPETGAAGQRAACEHLRRAGVL